MVHDDDYYLFEIEVENSTIIVPMLKEFCTLDLSKFEYNEKLNNFNLDYSDNCTYEVHGNYLISANFGYLVPYLKHFIKQTNLVTPCEDMKFLQILINKDLQEYMYINYFNCFSVK